MSYRNSGRNPQRTQSHGHTATRPRERTSLTRLLLRFQLHDVWEKAKLGSEPGLERGGRLREHAGVGVVEVRGGFRAGKLSLKAVDMQVPPRCESPEKAPHPEGTTLCPSANNKSISLVLNAHLTPNTVRCLNRRQTHQRSHSEGMLTLKEKRETVRGPFP